MSTDLTRQVQQFEELHQGVLEGITAPGVLTGEQLILAALMRISQQLAAIQQALSGKVTVPSFAAPPSSPETTVALAIPLTQLDIDQFVIAAGQTPGQGTSGYESGYLTQFAVTVPAASASGPGEAVVYLTPPPGYVVTLVAPAVVTTSDVGANVQVIIYTDGKPSIGPNGFVLGPSVQINVAQYLVVQNPETGLQIEFLNPSSSSVTIWLFANAMVIPRTFFEQFYQTLLNYGYQQIKSTLNITGV